MKDKRRESIIQLLQESNEMYSDGKTQYAEGYWDGVRDMLWIIMADDEPAYCDLLREARDEH